MTSKALRALPWLGAVLGAVAALTGDQFLVSVSISVVIWAILAIGLNLLMGYSGLIHLGMGAFYALGAYGAAKLGDRGVPTLATLLLLVVAGLLAALLVGPVVLRTKGLHFAVVTLGLGIIASEVMENWMWLTNGPLGIAGIKRPQGFTVAGWEFDPTGDQHFLVICLVVLLLCLVLAGLYDRSRVARVLRGARDDELLASSLGFASQFYRIWAFALASATAAGAGVLYAWFIRYISPAPFTFFALSFQVFVLVAVGGAGTVWGPVVGAVLLMGLPIYFDIDPHTLLITYGIALLIATVVMPKGIVPSLVDVIRHLVRRQSGGPAPVPPTMSTAGESSP